MNTVRPINGVLTTCLTIVGSAIALGGLMLVSLSNLRADLRAEIAINRADIAEIRRDLNTLNFRVGRIEGTLLAMQAGRPSPDADPIGQ